MFMSQRMKITRGGQITVPAIVRRRWGTSTVLVEDLGDRVVLHPAPDDPIAAASGALADEFGSVDVGELRRRARADERAAVSRRRTA